MDYSYASTVTGESGGLQKGHFSKQRSWAGGLGEMRDLRKLKGDAKPEVLAEKIGNVEKEWSKIKDSGCKGKIFVKKSLTGNRLKKKLIIGEDPTKIAKNTVQLFTVKSARSWEGKEKINKELTKLINSATQEVKKRINAK
jgi:hypothetical protein